VLLFAIASGLSVANVYYAQPLLDMLARDFAISQAAVGGVVTATQVGCALALLLLVPLGDIVERRRLMLLQLLALIAALGIVVMAQSAWVLLVGMLATGLLGTAMTQGLIACAASAADVQERGRVVGAAQSGVFIGLLLARVFAGVVSDLAGWRAVYGASALMMLVLLPLLWRQLPRFSASRIRQCETTAVLDADITLYRSRIANSRRAGVVNVCRLYDFLECDGAPAKCASYGFSHTVIGLFALAGVAGALPRPEPGAMPTAVMGSAPVFMRWCCYHWHGGPCHSLSIPGTVIGRDCAAGFGWAGAACYQSEHDFAHVSGTRAADCPLYAVLRHGKWGRGYRDHCGICSLWLAGGLFIRGDSKSTGADDMGVNAASDAR
jgi:MFS family permease